MKFNEKLRELRLAQKLTQEEVATYLGVTSQSVSKWERGILSPDIHLLPRIALLYKTSIDALFDMAFFRGKQHDHEFRDRVRLLSEQGDKNGVWNAFMTEIDLCPDRFDYSIDIMLYALQVKWFDNEHIPRLIHLADYADSHCHDDDQRNEIHRLMVQICGSSTQEEYRIKAEQYYRQLSMLRHSREIYAKFVLSGDAYAKQLRKNIMYMVDTAECAVRQMIAPDMPCEEKLYLYQRAAALYEAVLDDGFAGFYDIPLLCDYAHTVMLLFAMERKSEAERYLLKMLNMLDAFVTPEKQTPTARLITEPYPDYYTSPYASCIKLLRDILDKEAFAEHRHELLRILRLLEEKTEA